MRLSTLSGAIKLLFLLSLFMTIWLNSHAASPDGTLAREGGDIIGLVSYCGPEGSEGILVHIPGQSFSALTDVTGSFHLTYIPPGTWNLQFVRNGLRLGTLNSITVARKSITDITANQGVITICNDLDGDAFTPNLDCDETNPAINPSAVEICGDGKDNNCNGASDETCPTCTDSDGDGFYAQAFCDGFRDCNDNNTAINPGAQELCGDGIDNNCDGHVDENTPTNGQTFYFDGDSDGYGDNTNTVNACIPPDGYIAIGGDCNDNLSNINPSAPEICADGLDNNCNNQVDEVGCVNLGQCTQDDITFLQSCGIDLVCVNQVSQQCYDGLFALYQCAGLAGCDLASPDGQYCAYTSCTSQWETVFGPDILPGLTLP